jgi:hypothetical protein
MKESEYERELSELRQELERLNKLRTHCEHCGADYLQTGLEAGCPCRIIKEVERLKREVNALRKAAMCRAVDDPDEGTSPQELEEVRWSDGG